MSKVFRKVLSPNDANETGGHQAGILIPKHMEDLIKFLGGLDSSIKNPRKKLLFIDEEGMANDFNFIYYNNKFHSPQGTRNEYRLTGMTAYLRRYNAQSGAELELSRLDGEDYYRVSLIKEKTRESAQAGASSRIKLSGWRSVH
jgi:hypothetical protein